MLHDQRNGSDFRIFAIDPGTDTFGIALLTVNLVSHTITVEDMFTTRGSKMASAYITYEEIHGTRAAKILSHRETVLRLLQLHQPHAVIAESPFLGRFPQAFEALVQCMCAIRSAVNEFDPTMVLDNIDPKSAKKAVGVKTNDKESVQLAIRSMAHLVRPVGLFERADEHSFDAVAVGIWKAQQILAELQVR